MNMADTQVYPALAREPFHRPWLAALCQPMTATQLARKTGIPLDTCSYLISLYRDRGMMTCLNPHQRNSRLYGLTPSGCSYRESCLADHPHHPYQQPEIDWILYGTVCFNHRAAIIRHLTRPMQPAQIKRFLRLHDSKIRINLNNVLDVIRFLQSREIVQPVHTGKGRTQYELTGLGRQIRQLLLQA